MNASYRSDTIAPTESAGQYQERISRRSQSHRPARDRRPRRELETFDASPELGTAPWWADDANVDGCEITLRGRS